MRAIVSALAAASLALAPRLVAAQEPAPVVAPASPLPAAPAPVGAQPSPARRILYIHEDGSPAASPSDTATPSRLRSRALVIGGVATGLTGLALAIGGAAVVASAPDPRPCTDKELGAGALLLGRAGVADCVALGLGSGFGRTTGYTLAVVGGAGVAAGVVMAVVGSMPLHQPTREQAARGVPAVAVGPASATLRWSF